MKQRSLCNIVSFALCLLSFATASAKANVDSIYGGTQLKLDIASPALVAAISKGQRQHYEIGVNVRLKDRFYPTIELGYATNGGFGRLGVDINPLKKHPDSPHALLIGVRVATAVQEKGYTDCWGEIVAGCQVEVAKVNNTALYMGWMARIKCLFTRQQRYFPPDYIPGFGNRDNVSWGVNYYLGWRF